MAGNIKGIVIEFSGDTTKLDKALRDIQENTKKLDSELKTVDKALKFNPKSVELWSQKQQILTEKIQETEKRLDALKQAKAKADADPNIDKESAEYRQLSRDIEITENQLKRFNRELKKIGNVKLKALSEQFKKVGEKITGAGKKLTTSLTLPLAALGGVALNKFAEVDKIMQLTNSTMGNTAEEADLLNDAMKSAAASSTFGMNDAATATLNFARAGLTAKQAASALAPAMALAAGEGGDLEIVSAGLVATINGFGGSFDDAAYYADIFANACNNSALDVNSLSEAMSVAAPIFAAAGYDVKDAALYMGVMANKGIDANTAANSLKTGFAKLVSPAKEGAAMMEKLGISVTNADGSMKDSVTIQSELHDAFSNLSESEQIAAASAIFGKNQMSSWLALINTAPGEVDALNQSLGETGTATEMQAAMMQGFGGSIEQLKSGIDVLATSFGEALAPMIQKVIGFIQTIVDWFNSLSSETQTIIATIALVVAAIGPLLLIIGTLASSIGSIINLVGMIGPALSFLAGPVGIVIAVIAALIAVGVLLYKNWDTIKAKAIEIKDKLVQTWTNVKTKVLSIINGLKMSMQTTWNNIKSTATTAFNAVKNAIITPIQSAIDKVKSIIQKIKSFFPIKVGNLFKGLKLPHFKLTGKLSLNPPSIPKLSVDWYKTGGIFDSPSLIGVGEAGPEAVVPLDKLWKHLDQIADNTGGIVININGANSDPREIAEEVKRVLIQETNRRRLAWQ